MTLPRRLRMAMLVVIATGTAVAALCSVPAPEARAFYIFNHDRVVRQALPPGEVDEAAILQILLGAPPAAGAVGTDAFMGDDFRHIDNANNPAEICAQTQQAWNFFMPIVLGGAQPVGPGGTDLANGPAARAAFGGLVHALEDFYAHSNWVEDNIAVGQIDRLAPQLMPTCDPATLPAGLHTGYFDLDLGLHEDLLTGCPPGGPPPGFVECHSMLNKDGWNTPRGGVLLPAGVGVPGVQLVNYFDLAAFLATRDSTELFWQVRDVVVGNAVTQNPGVDGQCVAANLFQADRRQPCF